MKFFHELLAEKYSNMNQSNQGEFSFRLTSKYSKNDLKH